MSETLLEVRDLAVTFETPAGLVRAVRGVDVDVRPGEILGVVGESGCGKSVTFRAMLGLMGKTATVRGSAVSSGNDVGLSGALRDQAALIYQNPQAALNPVFTIGKQLALAAGTDDATILEGMLDQVGLADPKAALRAYPHEFSGGMQQRVVIALALAQKPDLLIADEPTTALDVTTQAQVLDLLDTLRHEHGLAIVLVSHDVGVIARLADRVAVMYAGRVVELGPAAAVLEAPGHPYTRALLEAIPGPHNLGRDLTTIPGQVPDGRSEIVDCSFAPRCAFAGDDCLGAEPALRPVGEAHTVACVRPGGER